MLTSENAMNKFFDFSFERLSLNYELLIVVRALFKLIVFCTAELFRNIQPSMLLIRYEEPRTSIAEEMFASLE